MNVKQTVGISGASGLLGTFVALELINCGYKVKCHRNKSAIPAELEKHELAWVEGDIRDQSVVSELIDGCEIIIHTAAMVSFERADQERMMAINIDGTRLIVDNIIGTNIKLIHISSISALGRVDQGMVVDENTTFNEELKNSAYAKSKYLSELQVHRGVAEGIEAMILLPSIILGKNASNTSSSTLWNQILTFPKFAPSGANGFVDVRDVVSACVSCLEHWKNGERFIINGHNLSYLNLYKLVVKNSKVKVNPIVIKPIVLLIMLPLVKFYFFVRRKNSKISKDAILTASKSYSYSNSKSTRTLGIEYTPIEKTVSDFTS